MFYSFSNQFEYYFLKIELDFFKKSKKKLICKLKISGKASIPFLTTIFDFLYENFPILFLWQKIFFFLSSLLKKNTSKIKKQRLICKTTDFMEYAHSIFKDHLWLFVWKFSETSYIEYLANTTLNGATYKSSCYTKTLCKTQNLFKSTISKQYTKFKD